VVWIFLFFFSFSGKEQEFSQPIFFSYFPVIQLMQLYLLLAEIFFFFENKQAK